MMKSLLALRFRALFAGLTRQGKSTNSTKKKKSGKGAVVLLSVLYLYVLAVLCGGVAFLFWTLAKPYHMLGLDWLYFAMAGTMALGFGVIGSVFTTQNQLYDAKDNDLLLSMPIPFGRILLSRLLPLMAMNLLFSGIVMVPATVVWAIAVECSLAGIFAQVLSLLWVCLLAQAIACILGWGLHLLLSRMNKSIASVVYTVVFLALYFSIYPQMGDILNAMAANGEAIADTLHTWVWPMYAMGKGALGEVLYLLAFTAIALGIFILVYWLLSVTFLRTVTARRSGKRRRLNMQEVKTEKPQSAVLRKELRRFLSCPVYLTNMGIGLLMIPGLTVAGVLLKASLLSDLGPLLPLLQPYIPMVICAMLAFCGSMVSISAPSVSLEGKSLWILKSLPVSGKTVLLSKLKFHCIMGAPLASVCGGVLSLVYGCSLPEILLCILIPGLLMLLNGLLGLLSNLKWPRFDWISEAYPCKQAAPVAISLFAMMGLPLVFGVLYYLLSGLLDPMLFLLLVFVLLAALCCLLYRVMLTWGVKKWNEL